MRTIAEGLIFRAAAAAELWILDCAGDVTFAIDEINGSGNAYRSALRIDKDLCVIAHLMTVGLSRGNREAPANVMGGAAST